MRPDSHTQLPITTTVLLPFFFCFFGYIAFFSESIFYAPLPFPLCMELECTLYVLSFRMVFFYLVTTGWIFDVSLRNNSTNQIDVSNACYINQVRSLGSGTWLYSTQRTGIIYCSSSPAVGSFFLHVVYYNKL